MSVIKKGSFELMKQMNVNAILQLLQNRGRLSRAEIAEITKLTPASVTNITKQLMREGLVSETGIGDSKGGRPPIIIELNSDARYVLGVNIGVGIIEVVLSNLSCEIVGIKRIRIHDNELEKSVDYVFTKVKEFIKTLIKEHEVPTAKILGIGFAITGIINPIEGTSIFAPFYGWRNIHIPTYMKDFSEFDFFFDNDVRAMALAEMSYGNAKEIQNFITVNICDGIGAAIVIDRKPLYGSDFSAGEIGHTVVEKEGALCQCGHHGCLTTIASNLGILQRFNDALHKGETSILQGIHPITIEGISYAASQGDSLAINILEETGLVLGLALANLVYTLNPQVFILNGDIIFQSEIVTQKIQQTIQAQCAPLPNADIPVLPSSLMGYGAISGAVSLVLQHFYSHYEMSTE